MKIHSLCGSKIGCKLKKYSPLGYSSTFIRGANTAKDKVYTLNSKSGKSLILSCDSTPSVFRNYVINSNGEAQRIAFIAPLFRYRNSHSRHFTQIGYSFINEKSLDDDEMDLNIIQLSKSMIDLFKEMGIKSKIHLNDYNALRQILGRYIAEKELPGLLYKLQFASKEERIDIFKKVIFDTDKCDELIQLFSQEPQKIRLRDKKQNVLNLHQEYMNIYKMGQALSYITKNEVYFDPTDLHSIETIDTFAVRFRTLEGTALGDGGEYTRYAQRWNSKIKRFWSVASGVEAIERNSPCIELDEEKRKIAMFNIDASSNFILRMMKKLEDKIRKSIMLIDKFAKLSNEELLSEFANIGISEMKVECLKKYLSSDYDTLKAKLMSYNNELVNEGIAEIDELYSYLRDTEAIKCMKFAPYLARGIDIYTGTVWEIFLKTRKVRSQDFNMSIGGGGRFDKIITTFVDDGKEYPAVGMSFGLDVIYEILNLMNEDKKTSTVDLYVIPMGTYVEAFKFISNMRKIGVKSDMEKREQKLKKSMNYANKMNIPYVIIIGEDEIKTNTIKLKDMNTGDTQEFVLTDYEKIKSFMNK